jgi:hypothetical protein
VKKGKERELGRLGWAASEKERGKNKKGKVSQAQLEKERENELYSNAFKFNFEI